MLKLTNVRTKYAKLMKPGKAYDDAQPDEWSVNMYLTDEDRDTLMANGVNPKEDKEGLEYWVAKRSVKTRAGDDSKPVPVVDSKKQPFREDLGNGSVCNVVVTLFPWSKGKRSGIKLYLNAVQVVNHVPFGGAGGVDEFDVLDSDADTDALSQFP